MAAELILATGGARSGKSSFALKLAQGMKGRKVFIATAQAGDEEMRVRIENHRRERPDTWHTIEEPFDLVRALDSCAGACEVVLIDCVALWVSNLLLKGGEEQEIMRAVGSVLARCKTLTARVIMVSNEVGMGIVPADRLSRLFRDILGKTNQEIASAADEVFLLAAGIPLQLKGKSGSPFR